MDPEDLLRAEPAALWQLRLLFMSYRWEGEEHEAWVRRFAEGLMARGYPVVLDRILTEAPGASTDRMEQLLHLFGHLGRATHFVPILTEGYSQRLLTGAEGHDATWKDGWVYDEWVMAVSKSKAQQLLFEGIWRSGAQLPPPFNPDNVLDFRGDDLEQALDRYYPPFQVLVTGLRDNEPSRVVGPVLYTAWPEVATRLQHESGYDDFAVQLYPPCDVP